MNADRTWHDDNAPHYPRRTMPRDAYRRVDSQCRRAAREDWETSDSVYIDARDAAYLDLDCDDTVLMSDGSIMAIDCGGGLLHIDRATVIDRLTGYDVNPLLTRSEAKAMEGGE